MPQISGNSLNGSGVHWPQIKAMSVSQVASAYGISEPAFISALKTEYGLNSILGSDLFQTLPDNYGVAPARVKEIAASLKTMPTQGGQKAAPVVQNASSMASSTTPKPMQPLTYYYAWLTALISLSYAATYYAAYM